MPKIVRGNSCGAKINLKMMQEGGKSFETKGPKNRTSGKVKKEKDEDK